MKDQRWKARTLRATKYGCQVSFWNLQESRLELGMVCSFGAALDDLSVRCFCSSPWIVPKLLG